MRLLTFTFLLATCAVLSSLGHPWERISSQTAPGLNKQLPTVITQGSVPVHIVPSRDALSKISVSQLVQANEDLTLETLLNLNRAVLIGQILAGMDEVEALKIREKRDADDDSKEDDDDRISTRGDRMKELFRDSRLGSLLSKLIRPRTSTPAIATTKQRTSAPTSTVSTTQSVTPSSQVTRHRRRTRPANLRTTQATQQTTTPAGFSRTSSPTTAGARRCPRQSEMNRIKQQMASYSDDEVYNIIQCFTMYRNRLSVRATTTTTTAPRRTRGGDVNEARAKDMLTVG